MGARGDDGGADPSRFGRHLVPREPEGLEPGRGGLGIASPISLEVMHA
jgi:hypothetical protein